MKLIDVTAPVYEGMPVYKNKPEKQPKFVRHTHGEVTESRLELDAHTGTHIDAPLHMLKDGETFEAIPLETLVGPVRVLDLTHVEDGITKTDLEPFGIQEGEFLFFKTRNSFEEAFNFNFIFLKADGAEYLAERKVKGVGTDALGIERSQPEHPTHKALFQAGIVIIEGLRLKEAEEKTYRMVAAPMKLIGTDAAPARVVLMEMD